MTISDVSHDTSAASMLTHAASQALPDPRAILDTLQVKVGQPAAMIQQQEPATSLAKSARPGRPSSAVAGSSIAQMQRLSKVDVRNPLAGAVADLTIVCPAVQASPGEALFATWMPATAPDSHASCQVQSPAACSTATGARMAPLITSRLQTAQGVSAPPSPVSAAICDPASAVVSAAASMQQANPLLKLAPVTHTHTGGVATVAQNSPSAFSLSFHADGSGLKFAGSAVKTESDQVSLTPGQKASKVDASSHVLSSTSTTPRSPGAVPNSPGAVPKNLGAVPISCGTASRSPNGELKGEAACPAKWQSATGALSGQWRTWTAAEASFKSLAASAASVAT